MTPPFRLFLAVLSGAAMMVSCAASDAAARHPCANIGTLLAAVYDQFDAADVGEDLGVLARQISDEPSMLPETRRILVAGLTFLVTTYQTNAGKIPTRNEFVAGGGQICKAEFGAPRNGGLI